MIRLDCLKATKTSPRPHFSPAEGKTGIDNLRHGPVFRGLFRPAQAGLKATLPGSSVAEQVTVNHLVAGSIPARAAMAITWPEAPSGAI